MNEVIGEPPLFGAVQLIVTLVFEFVDVDGLAGKSGFAAALTSTSDESAPKPATLRAVTLNVYTTSEIRVLAV